MNRYRIEYTEKNIPGTLYKYVIGTEELVASSGTTIIGNGTDSEDGSATTVIGSNDIVGSDGDTLISKESDGSVHIGENSLVTVEENGVQQLYATDANGDMININIKKGTDLLIDGVSVSGSLNTNATNIATNKITPPKTIRA